MPQIWDWGIAKDVGLFALAVYGAALSTFNWRQAVKRDRRSLSIKVKTVMPTYGSQLGPPFASIAATNSGARPVTINVLTFMLADGRRMFPMHEGGFPGYESTSLPAVLSDGETAITVMSYGDIAAAVRGTASGNKVKITPVAEDSLGGVHTGEHFEVDIAEFEKMSA